MIVACAVAGGALEYEPGVRDDGISFTDYRLLLKEIGTDQGIEIISAEHLLFDYISRPVAREIELCTWIRADCESLIANACAGKYVVRSTVRCSTTRTGLIQCLQPDRAPWQALVATVCLQSFILLLLIVVADECNTGRHCPWSDDR